MLPTQRNCAAIVQPMGNFGQTADNGVRRSTPPRRRAARVAGPPQQQPGMLPAAERSSTPQRKAPPPLPALGSVAHQQMLTASVAETPALRESFVRSDTNVDGFLDLREVQRMLADQGFDAEEGYVAELMATFDRDGNGHIDRSEFAQLFHMVDRDVWAPPPPPPQSPPAAEAAAPAPPAPPAPPAAAASLAAATSKQQICVAVDAFVASQPGDLSFHTGEKIVVTDSTQSWWVGYRASDPNSAEGSFPSNFVAPFAPSAEISASARSPPPPAGVMPDDRPDMPPRDSHYPGSAPAASVASPRQPVSSDVNFEIELPPVHKPTSEPPGGRSICGAWAKKRAVARLLGLLLGVVLPLVLTLILWAAGLMHDR